jgi:hypothetical protein
MLLIMPKKTLSGVFLHRDEKDCSTQTRALRSTGASSILQERMHSWRYRTVKKDSFFLSLLVIWSSRVSALFFLRSCSTRCFCLFAHDIWMPSCVACTFFRYTCTWIWCVCVFVCISTHDCAVKSTRIRSSMSHKRAVSICAHTRQCYTFARIYEET